MVPKITRLNRLTVSNLALGALGFPLGRRLFEIGVEDGLPAPIPVQFGSADGVRRRLQALGITEADVEDAVASARR